MSKKQRQVTLVINITEEAFKKLQTMAKHGGDTLNDYLAYVIGYRYADWIKQDKEWND
jgi:ubiquinone biosynthesis protein Coq4